MEIKNFDESSRRYTFGFPGAEFCSEAAAREMAEYKYRAVVREYGSEIKESFDQALQVERNALRLKLTRVVEV